MRQHRVAAVGAIGICMGLTCWWLRRMPCRDWEVRRFGTAMAQIAFSQKPNETGGPSAPKTAALRMGLRISVI